MEAHGADAVRWYFAASGSPWSTRRIGSATLDEIVRKVLLTYWNTVCFLALYANAAGAQGMRWGSDMLAGAPPPTSRPLLDRWVLSELSIVTSEVTAALEEFDTAAAGRRLTTFVDDLSNWYVRRSRRRFWEGPGTPDGAAAFATLYQCLETLTKLMAPIVPFLTDYVWGILRGPHDPESVHLTTWPSLDPGLVDRELSAQMGLARRLVELGRSVRAAESLGIRQPLPRAVVDAPGFGDLSAELRAQVADELNVRVLEPASMVADRLVEYVVKPNYRALGRRFADGTQAVAAAIGAADASKLASELEASGSTSVTIHGPTAAAIAQAHPGTVEVSAAQADTFEVRLGSDDVIVTQVPRAGWPSAEAAGARVSLDVAITPELRREVLAREVIRLVQDARKADGLEVSDRLALPWEETVQEIEAA